MQVLISVLYYGKYILFLPHFSSGENLAKMWEKPREEISTSIWSAKHPNAGQKLQKMCIERKKEKSGIVRK